MKGMKYLTALFFLSVFFSGWSKTFTIETGQFEKLKINGNVSVIYKNLPDSTGFARYSDPEGNDALFSFNMKSDGSLKVEPSDDKWGRKDLPVLFLYSDFLSSIESYSNQSIIIESLAPCASFNVNEIGNGSITVNNVKCNNVTAAITTGNGSIFISGKCLNANFRMVGAGLISADRLSAENIKCRILGTGSIGCWPVDNLSVTGLGTTKIYYKGKPNIKKSGGGKLFELPDNFEEENDLPGRVEIPSFSPSASNHDLDEEDSEDDEEEDEDDDENYQTVVTSDD